MKHILILLSALSAYGQLVSKEHYVTIQLGTLMANDNDTCISIFKKKEVFFIVNNDTLFPCQGKATKKVKINEHGLDTLFLETRTYARQNEDSLIKIKQYVFCRDLETGMNIVQVSIRVLLNQHSTKQSQNQLKKV